VSALNKRRDLFKRKLYYQEFRNLSKDDIFLLGGIEQLIEVIIDLNELKMAIEHKG
jgi:hypothetical protein